MNAYKQPDVGKSRSIFTPGATAAGCCCCFISEDSLSHPDLSLWLAWPSSPWRSVLPVSGPASSYLSFLSSVPVFVVSFDPTFIARCGICDSLREPTTVRTFLFQTRLLFSLLFGSAPFSFFSPPLSLSLVFSVLSLSSYVFAPHLSFTLSLSPFVSLLVSLLISLPVPRCAQPLQEGPAVLFLRSAIDFVSSVFCTGCTGMKAGTYS